MTTTDREAFNAMWAKMNDRAWEMYQSLREDVPTPPKTILYSLHPDREELRQQMEGVPGFEYAFALTRGQIGFEERDGVWRLPDDDISWFGNIQNIARQKIGDDSDGSGHVVSVDLELGRVLEAGQVRDVLDVLDGIRVLFPNLKISLYGHPFNGDADVYAESRLAAAPIYESGLFDYFGPSCYAGRVSNLVQDGLRFLEVLDRTADCCATYDVEAMPNFNQRNVHAHPQVGTQLVPERVFMERSRLMIERFGRVMLWSEGFAWLNLTREHPEIIDQRPQKFGRYLANLRLESEQHGIELTDGWEERTIQANSKRSYERVLKVGETVGKVTTD